MTQLVMFYRNCLDELFFEDDKLFQNDMFLGNSDDDENLGKNSNDGDQQQNYKKKFVSMMSQRSELKENGNGVMNENSINSKFSENRGLFSKSILDIPGARKQLNPSKTSNEHSLKRKESLFKDYKEPETEKMIIKSKSSVNKNREYKEKEQSAILAKKSPQKKKEENIVKEMKKKKRKKFLKRMATKKFFEKNQDLLYDSPISISKGSEMDKFRKNSEETLEENNEELQEFLRQRADNISKIKMNNKTGLFLVSFCIIMFHMAVLVFFEINKKNYLGFLKMTQAHSADLTMTNHCVKMSYRMMYESLSRSEYPLIIDQVPNFETYTQEGYNNLGKIVNILNIEEIQNSQYIKTLKSVYMTNICTSYLERVAGEACTQELESSGLETVSIFILENSRKILNQFEALVQEGSRSKSQIAEELLNSQDGKTLGKFFRLIF
jgi:hypothetical protein